MIGSNINELKKKANRTMILRNLRFVFYFYAFISFIFWFLNCFEINGLYMFSDLFMGPYKIVSLFYNPESSSIDFSLAIIGIVSLIIGVIIDSSCSIYLKKLDKLRKIEEENNREKQKRLLEQRTGRNL